MNIFKNIRHYIKQMPKKTLIAVAAVSLFAAVPVSMTLAEFYPDRPTFDYNKPCNPDDNDPYDRCGSLTGPVFNSFVNTPSYGDERAFVDARRSDQTAAGSYENVLNNVTDGSKEVVIRMYVHNNANQSTNADGTGISRDTRVRVFLPTGTNDALRARGYISSSNATPRLVEDTVDLVGNERFSLDYVEGSAILYDNDNFSGGVKLSDSIVGESGALIGTDALDGNVKGCFEYEAVVQLRVKIIPEEVPEVEINKQVATAGQESWGETATVNPGEKVKWLVTFQNTGETELDDVRVSDMLPPHLDVVPESVRYIDANQDVVQSDTALFTTGGIDFGDDWQPEAGFYVRFDTTARDNFEGCEVTLRNIATVFTDRTASEKDHADVKIKKEPCEQPEEPVYACDLLKAEKIGDKTYRFTTSTTAENGASVRRYMYNFGDNTEVLNTDKNVVEHTYAEAGTYVASVQVEFAVDGRTEVVSSDACKAPINIDVAPKPPVTPPTTPPQLPETGAGDIIGLFAATTAAGALAHKLVWARRY